MKKVIALGFILASPSILAMTLADVRSTQDAVERMFDSIVQTSQLINDGVKTIVVQEVMKSTDLAQSLFKVALEKGHIQTVNTLVASNLVEKEFAHKHFRTLLRQLEYQREGREQALLTFLKSEAKTLANLDQKVTWYWPPAARVYKNGGVRRTARPLKEAIRLGKRKVCLALLEAGADVTVLDERNVTTVFEFAVKEGNVQVINMLVDRNLITKSCAQTSFNRCILDLEHRDEPLITLLASDACPLLDLDHELSTSVIYSARRVEQIPGKIAIAEAVRLNNLRLFLALLEAGASPKNIETIYLRFQKALSSQTGDAPRKIEKIHLGEGIPESSKGQEAMLTKTVLYPGP